MIEPFTKVAAEHPDIVSLDSDGYMTGDVMDFFHMERVEMHKMSVATEIAPNLWMGPTPDAAVNPPRDCSSTLPSDAVGYDLFIEATDMAQIPDKKAYTVLETLLSKRRATDNAIPQLEFPASGSIMPPTWSQTEVDGLMQTCDWIYRQANGVSEEPRGRKDSKFQIEVSETTDGDGDSIMTDGNPPTPGEGRKMLLHCADGYTETSLLALAYYMYVHCVPVHTAYLDLHTKHKRNFFSYPTDVALLTSIQPRILQASPQSTGSINNLVPSSPNWLSKMDGSLPSRIMDYMYLGNLGHANNPELLRELGIGQILSVGEPVTWSEQDKKAWIESGAAAEKVLYVDGVQDNGVDPLTKEFKRCLEFIEQGRKEGTSTLVHCRVGVSRSATICIAEVMKELGLSFPRA